MFILTAVARRFGSSPERESERRYQTLTQKGKWSIVMRLYFLSKTEAAVSLFQRYKAISNSHI